MAETREPEDSGDSRDSLTPVDTFDADTAVPGPDDAPPTPDTSRSDAPLDGLDSDAATADALDDLLSDDITSDVDAEVDVEPGGCEGSELGFVDLPEASGAVALDLDHDLLVADSGHSGRALVLARTGAPATPLMLPLGDGAGDDIEGLSRAPDGLIYGLTSSGYLRAWQVERSQGAWVATLVHGPVAIAEPGEWVGGPNAVNAAGNFEGICLHPAPAPEACAGWAASKARGDLVCLRSLDGSYRLDPQVRLSVFTAEHLSDCAFEAVPPYRLFAAGNVYSGDRLTEVQLGEPAETPRLSDLTGAPNQEAILVRNVAGALELQSFGDWQDLAGDRSPRIVFMCNL